MVFLSTKEDYEALGITPPTRVVHEEVDRRIDDHHHVWRQRGPEVYCEAGPHRHGHLVDMSKILIGQDGQDRPLYRTLDIT